MANRVRVTLTNNEAESATGKKLLNMIFEICHDGVLEIGEVEDLHIFLRRDTSGIAAIDFLRAITREAIADGSIDDTEAYRLKVALERVVPKEMRGIISTHLESIGLPAMDDEDLAPSWTRHEATARQIEYILALGGKIHPKLTKGEASMLIEGLLERRPPTPRQVMLLRFFNRLDLLHSSKDKVSFWIDELFATDSRMEHAWTEFKHNTNHDPSGVDPSVVPVGACSKYLGRRERKPTIASRVLGWFSGAFRTP